MTERATHDWDPGAYGRFRGLRLRPALDLLARVPAELPAGDIVDLGCGSGHLGPALREHWPDRCLIGVDLSPAMVSEARRTGCYDRIVLADIEAWLPDTPPALIFSNAVLHWVPDHPALLPHLADLLATGGTLAVQMPDQHAEPSHSLLRDVSARLFPELFDWSAWAPEVLAPGRLHALLAPLGRLEVWQTTYFQCLPPAAHGHPVRRFTESTAARPILSQLSHGAHRSFLDAYDAALAAPYPLRPDGTVLLPFHRLFLTLERG